MTLPLLYDHAHPRSIEEADAKAEKLLDMVGLSGRIHHQPHELSGGQQQRVAIARSLINDPVLIIGDEPTGNLDSKSGVEIMNLLHTLHAQGTTIVMVTHDQKITAHTQRTINLLDGLVDTITHNGHDGAKNKQVQYETV